MLARANASDTRTNQADALLVVRPHREVMMSDTILLKDSQDGVVRLTLNRPAQRNALSRALIADLSAALDDAAGDAQTRVVVLTGQPPAFCAGLDLKEVAASSPEQAEQDADALVGLFDRLERLRKPTIAMVAGPAVAGGAGLISLCDLVIAGESAIIGYPEIKRGLVGAVVSTYLRRLVGERQARYLLLTGENLTARRALDYGLCTEVVADGALGERVDHYARMLAGYPQQALANTKRLLDEIRDLPHRQALAAARQLNAEMRTSDESRSAIDDFFRK